MITPTPLWMSPHRVCPNVTPVECLYDNPHSIMDVTPQSLSKCHPSTLSMMNPTLLWTSPHIVCPNVTPVESLYDEPHSIMDVTPQWYSDQLEMCTSHDAVWLKIAPHIRITP